MTHEISFSTVEAMMIIRALNCDFETDVERVLAEKVTTRVKNVVAKDLKKKKPTDLSGKCGSYKWAKPRRGSYIDCVCPTKRPTWFARTAKACKKYEVKLKGENNEN